MEPRAIINAATSHTHRLLLECLWHQTHAAVGLAVTSMCTSSRRPWAMKINTYNVLNVRVGTVNRSAAHK